MRAAAPVDAIATARCQLRGAATDGALFSEITVERDAVGIAIHGVGRLNIDAAEHAAVIVEAALAIGTGQPRNTALIEDSQESRDRVQRHAGGLQSQRPGVQQRLVGTRVVIQLIRHAIERLVQLDWTGGQPAERNVSELCAQCLRRAVGPLQLRRVGHDTDAAIQEI